jgi:hypothetical protein
LDPGAALLRYPHLLSSFAHTIVFPWCPLRDARSIVEIRHLWEIIGLDWTNWIWMQKSEGVILDSYAQASWIAF